MKNILVIDDEEQVRDALKKILERSGYQVKVAENGKVGVSIFQSWQADLVITDLTMPEKDGMETIEDLLKIKPNLNIIVISGGGHRFPEYFLDKAKDKGACLSLKKPVRAQELVKTVEKIFEDEKIADTV